MRRLTNCAVAECTTTRWGLLLLIRHQGGISSAYYRCGPGRWALLGEGRFKLHQGPHVPTATYQAELN